MTTPVPAPLGVAPVEFPETLPYTVSLPFLGQTRRYVVEIDDPTAPGSIARSNELLLTYGY